MPGIRTPFPRFVSLIAAALVLSPAPTMAQEPEAAEADARRLAEEERLRNDWANLTRYREANAELNDPAPGERRVAAIVNARGVRIA